MEPSGKVRSNHLQGLRIVALFAALVVSLTLAAAASADVSFTKAYGWGVIDGASQFETCTSTCQAGIEGGGAGQLDGPDGVATDSSGDVYVADNYNNRIDEFSASGAFIKAYGWGVSDGRASLRPAPAPARPGRRRRRRAARHPVGVAIDPSGDVYVADTYNDRIDEFSAAGAFIKAYGWGVSDGQASLRPAPAPARPGSRRRRRAARRPRRRRHR